MTEHIETAYRALVNSEMGLQVLAAQQEVAGGIAVQERDAVLQGALLDMALLAYALHTEDYGTDDRKTTGFAIVGLDHVCEALLGFRVRVPHNFSFDRNSEQERYQAWRKDYLEARQKEYAEAQVAEMDDDAT